MNRFTKRLSILTLVACGASVIMTGSNRSVTPVYSNNDFQLTGVSISKTGRLFVNFPRWSDRYTNAVLEVMKDGSTKPFPDAEWNKWDNKPASAGQHLVCVQSVVVDSTDALWILDPAAPLTGSIVPGGPKMVKVDLSTNKVARVIAFGPEIARTDSYLNDVRFDNKRNVAYITDSGAGGIVVVDLATGKSHRALDGHPSVMKQEGVSITLNGKPVLGPTGKPPAFNSDGIALSPDGEYLYYQALTSADLYRVKTSLLRDNNGSGATSGVEKVAHTFPVDGMWMDPQGRLYLSDLNNNAVKRLTPDGTGHPAIETVVMDSRLIWPDTFTQAADGTMYITASHISEEPTYNKGKEVRTLPYSVFKFQP